MTANFGDGIYYPGNPFLTDDAVYVAADGVSRFNKDSDRPEWDALQGLHTFELVVVGHLALVGTTVGLFALERDTGEVRWRAATDHVIFTPTVVNGIAYAGQHDGTLHAIDLVTGDTRWKKRFDGWIYTPAVADGTLIIGGRRGLLYGIDPETGNERWRLPQIGELTDRPVAIGPRHISAATFNGDVFVVAGDTGNVIWRSHDGVASYPPAVTAERLYFAGFDGVLRARDASSGKLLWSHRAGDRLSSIPAINGHTVATSNHDGEVALLDTSNGRLLLHKHVPFMLAGRPSLVDDQLVFFSNQRQLLRLPIRDQFSNTRIYLKEGKHE